MTEFVRRLTIIVPADRQAEANLLAAQVDTAGGMSTFGAPLSTTGEEPATHLIASGVARSEDRDTVLALGGFAEVEPGYFENTWDPPARLWDDLNETAWRVGPILAEAGLSFVRSEES